MKKFGLYALLILPLLLNSCGLRKQTQQSAAYDSYDRLSVEDKKLADTLIKRVLDNEGLFTVIGKLKPMSSVTELHLKIAAKDSSVAGARAVTDTTSADLKKLARYQRVVNCLQFGDLNFMLSPYKISQKGERGVQISVFRRSLVDSVVRANQTFFGQFGFVAGIHPQVLINTTEYEESYNRFRSYGYLFGYPEHAVNFFTQAAKSQRQTGVFVKRKFFQIPVFSDKSGRFVYALPTDYTPSSVDSALLDRAGYFLSKYRLTRAKFVRKDGSVRYYELLTAMIR